tara:strand:- start:1854 stop:2126 length:273 start_codon:yes stop_codon:yes gene_type:complete
MTTGSWGNPPPINTKKTKELALMLQHYCQNIGWELVRVSMGDGLQIHPDYKVSLLKIAPVCEVVKDVGFRGEDDCYYVMRDKTKENDDGI